LALGGTSAAHATQCTVDSGSVLEDSLLSESGSEGSCGVKTSIPGEEGGETETLSVERQLPVIWHQSHDGWQQHDGRDCTPNVVPLPPSSLLLVSGALALLILGRCRRPATA
jgi:hypothetical protein